MGGREFQYMKGAPNILEATSEATRAQPDRMQKECREAAQENHKNHPMSPPLVVPQESYKTSMHPSPVWGGSAPSPALLRPWSAPPGETEGPNGSPKPPERTIAIVV